MANIQPLCPWAKYILVIFVTALRNGRSNLALTPSSLLASCLSEAILMKASRRQPAQPLQWTFGWSRQWERDKDINPMDWRPSPFLYAPVQRTLRYSKPATGDWVNGCFESDPEFISCYVMHSVCPWTVENEGNALLWHMAPFIEGALLCSCMKDSWESMRYFPYWTFSYFTLNSATRVLVRPHSTDSLCSRRRKRRRRRSIGKTRWSRPLQCGSMERTGKAFQSIELVQHNGHQPRTCVVCIHCSTLIWWPTEGFTIFMAWDIESWRVT